MEVGGITGMKEGMSRMGERGGKERKREEVGMTTIKGPGDSRKAKGNPYWI